MTIPTDESTDRQWREDVSPLCDVRDFPAVSPKREAAILETIARRVERSGATPEAHRKARKAALHALMRGASGHRALAAAQDAIDGAAAASVEIHPTPSAAKFAREAKADPTRWNIRPVGRDLAHELRFTGEAEVSSDD